MRTLSKLYLQFSSTVPPDIDVGEMFTKKNLSPLRQATEALAQNQDEQKHGAKLNLNAVIQRTLKTLIGLYAEKMEDGKVEETKHFRDAYNFRAPEVYAAARYQSVINSLNKARRPENLISGQKVVELSTTTNPSAALSPCFTDSGEYGGKYIS